MISERYQQYNAGACRQRSNNNGSLRRITTTNSSFYCIAILIIVGFVSLRSTINGNNEIIIVVSAVTTSSVPNSPANDVIKKEAVLGTSDSTTEVEVNDTDFDNDRDNLRSTKVSLLRKKQKSHPYHRSTPTDTINSDSDEEEEKVEEEDDDEESDEVEEDEETSYYNYYTNNTTTTEQERRRRRTASKLGTPYSLIGAKNVGWTMKKFQKQYPRLIRVTTSQNSFGLQAASYDNTADDCPFDTGVNGCLNYYGIIQDYVVHPVGSVSSNALPTILWSGALHGDERVGPTAVIEATQILLYASTCERYKSTSDASKRCRLYLQSTYGINDTQRRWLARLVTTRRIIVVPTANALGYYSNIRQEGYYDANRDFPYDLLNSDCMNTIAARTLNELFRTNIVQMSLTFHGGTECIAYEWGATSWYGYNSPDDIAQNRLCKSMQIYAGKFGSVPLYPIGSSNSLVYDIRGGMEDWAYAGSWDPDRVPKCQPNTYGGYPTSKTTYGPADLRDFNILVETSNDKTPPLNSLGTTYQILNPSSSGNGHVPRNIRVSLATAELVEPYVTFRAVNGNLRNYDIKPFVRRNGQTCGSGQGVVKIKYSSSKPTITIDWIIGGALQIDNTKLWFAKWSEVPKLNCLTQPATSITNLMKTGTMISSTTGLGRYTPSGTATTFKGSINIKNYKIGDKIVVLVETSVDSNWKDTVPNTAPDVLPQSHMVNVRTNSSWYYKNSVGHTVQGRKRWFSIPPLTIKLVL